MGYRGSALKATKNELNKLLTKVERDEYSGREWVPVEGSSLSLRIRGKEVAGYLYKRVKRAGESRSKPVKRKICGAEELRSIGLRGAMDRADRELVAIRSGQEEQKVSPPKVTLRELAEEKLAQGRRGEAYSERYQRDVRSVLSTVLADLAEKPAVEITRVDVERVAIDYVKENRKRGASKDGGSRVNTSMRILDAVWNFGRQRYGEASGFGESPVKVMGEKQLWHQENARSRVLQKEETGPWLRALFEVGNAQQSLQGINGRDSLLLFLFTGLRREALLKTTREQIDLGVGMIEAPGKTDTIVPMTHQVRQIVDWRLRMLDTMAPGSPWLFPGRGPETYYKDPKKLRQSVNERAGIKDLTTHDLRRTFKTIGAEIGVDPTLLDRLTGHVIQGVNNHYIQQRVDTQRQQAQRIVDQILADAGFDVQAHLDEMFGPK